MTTEQQLTWAHERSTIAVRLTLWERGGVKTPFPLVDGIHLVGREAHCHVVLDAPNISGEHLSIEVAGGQVVVEDLESTNGTFVNGRRIEGRVRISSTDLLYLGDYVAWFEGELEDLPQERTVPPADALVMASAPPPTVHETMNPVAMVSLLERTVEPAASRDARTAAWGRLFTTPGWSRCEVAERAPVRVDGVAGVDAVTTASAREAIAACCQALSLPEQPRVMAFERWMEMGVDVAVSDLPGGGPQLVLRRWSARAMDDVRAAAETLAPAMEALLRREVAVICVGGTVPSGRVVQRMLDGRDGLADEGVVAFSDFGELGAGQAGVRRVARRGGLVTDGAVSAAGSLHARGGGRSLISHLWSPSSAETAALAPAMSSREFGILLTVWGTDTAKALESLSAAFGEGVVRQRVTTLARLDRSPGGGMRGELLRKDGRAVPPPRRPSSDEEPTRG